MIGSQADAGLAQPIEDEVRSGSSPSTVENRTLAPAPRDASPRRGAADVSTR